MQQLITLLSDLDALAASASAVDLRNYKNKLRFAECFSRDGSEQGAYYGAVLKADIAAAAKAFPLLLVHDIYTSEAWEMDEKPFGGYREAEWGNLLKTIWIPEYLSLAKTAGKVNYKIVSENEFAADWLPITSQIAKAALRDPIVQIVKYGELHAWNAASYFIETTDEFVNLQYFTTA